MLRRTLSLATMVAAIAIVGVVAACSGGKTSSTTQATAPASGTSIAVSEASLKGQPLDTMVSRFGAAMGTGDAATLLAMFTTEGMRKAMDLQSTTGAAITPSKATPASVAVHRAGGEDSNPGFDVVLAMGGAEMTLHTSWRMVDGTWKVEDIAMKRAP